MSNTKFDSKSNIQQLNTRRKKIIKSIYKKDLIFYLAAVSTIAGGILHLLMLGPALKPINFPMQLLPYTDDLFTISGILQILWCIPMIKRWGKWWYYIGLVGTIALSLLLILTRIPNGITHLPLEDKNPMALLTEISQFLFIGITIIIIIYESHSTSKFNKKIEYLKHNYQIKKLKDDNQWLKERCEIRNQVVEENEFKIKNIKNTNTKHNNAETLTLQGIDLIKAGRYDEAIRYFEEALKINPTYSNALYNMGRCLNKTGRQDEAIETYGKAKCLLRTNWL